MSKYQLVLLFCVIFTSHFFAKETDTIPKKISNSIPQLAKYLTQNIDEEGKKVEAIYTWVTHNIAYDYDKLESNKMLIGVDPSKTLKARKTICSGYVELLRAMLDEINVESETVNGYTKNSHWTAGDTLFEESHAWIAIKVDGLWCLADPTWDAGYIGRIPKKDFKERRYLQKNFNWENREKRVLNRREKRREKRYANWEEKDDYTNKTGFVPYPSQEYYLIHPDTFLLSHLPTNPIWQLRNEKISLLEFTQKEENLIQSIEAKSNSKIFNKSVLKEYLDNNFLEQLILNGDNGQPFNKYNPGIKLLYYYNYLSLITHKDLQDLARGSVYAITPSKYPELSAKNDTVIEYLKRYKKFEKAYYKKNKDIDKENFKTAESNNRDLLKNSEKLLKEHEKLMESIEKNTEKIESQNEKYLAIQEKIQQNYPKAVNYKAMESFDTSVVTHWMDSIFVERNQINALMDALNNKRKNTLVKKYVRGLAYTNRILEVNKSLIPFNNYSTSATINEIDSLAIAKTAWMISLADDSITLELLEREIYDHVKKIEMHTKMAKQDFREMKSRNEIEYPFRYEVFMNAMLYKDIQNALDFNASSLNFNENISSALKKYDFYIKDVEKLAKDQQKLKEDKFKHNSKLTKSDHKRALDMMKTIEKNAEKWEEKYKL